MKLAIHIIRRLFLMLIVMTGVAIMVFLITRIIPADPVGAILGGNAPIETVDRMRHQLGLDKPIYSQFTDYMGGIVRGDFGISLASRRPVIEDLKEFFPATMELAMFSMVISVILGIVSGVFSAIRHNEPADHVLRVVSILGVSMPVFWIGLLLLLVFYFHLGWLPGGGRHSMFVSVPYITGFMMLDCLMDRNPQALADVLRHMILPAFVLGYASTASISRITRASMLDVLRQDYIRTARAKGLPRHIVIFRHALRNALIPVVTVIGMTFGNLLSGAVLTETVFSFPGIGRYIVNALLNLDYPAITGGTILIAFIYSFANLMVDAAYVMLDPRMGSSFRD